MKSLSTLLIAFIIKKVILDEECPKGKWGESCSKDCDPNCNVTEINCDIVTGHCSNCIDGYYSEKDTTKCVECKSECEFKCFDETGCEKCKDPKGYSKWCDLTCDKCLEDSQGNYCSRDDGKCLGECVLGSYGVYCKQDCPENCDLEKENCKKDSGNCPYCKKGFYPPECKSCMPECLECESEKKCSKCRDREKYGEECNKDCDQNCDRNVEGQEVCGIEGECVACVHGYYGEICEDKCKDQECEICDRTSGICNKCKKDFYLDPEDSSCHKCDEKCDECTKTECIDCKDKSAYGDFCDKNCSAGCDFDEEGRKCNKKDGICKKCLESFKGDYCEDCIDGRYGENCEFQCEEGCNKTICRKDDGYCGECKVGYFGDKCEGKCPENCKRCNKTTGICEECEDGFYGEKCELNCSAHCKEGKCDIVTGECQCEEFFTGELCDRCIDGHTGENCTEKCAPGCEDGKCERDGSCNCTTGFYSLICNETCPENCDLNEVNCDKKTGNCQSCKKGFFKDKCDEKCLDDNCEICDIKTGACTTCKETFFLNQTECQKCPDDCKDNLCSSDGCNECASLTRTGLFCDEDCPMHCKHEDETKRKCSRKDGTCDECEGNFSGLKCEECIDGFYSEDCNKKCGNCKMKACKKDTGYCESCENGYYSRNCTEKCPESCDTEVMNCNMDNGDCETCKFGFYSPKCEKCPNTCLGCTDAKNCTDCDASHYGDGCENDCPKGCQGGCLKDSGFCTSCKKGFYDLKCDLTCEGCKNSCRKSDGSCEDYVCDSGYYSPYDRCSKKCDTKCKDGCDLYTGVCNKCEDSMRWGIKCEKVCSKLCKDDNRADCCFVNDDSEYRQYPIFDVEVDDYSHKNEETHKHAFLTIEIGEKPVKLKVLMDYQSNYPLVIFDRAHSIACDKESKIFNLAYASNESSTYEEDKEGFFKSGLYYGVEISKAIPAFEKISITSKDGQRNTFKISFLVATELKVNSNFTLSSINGIVGIGLKSHFLGELLKANIIKKNILVREATKERISGHSSLILGNYNKKLKDSFSEITSLIPSSTIEMSKGNYILNAQMDGFAYRIYKAYKESVPVEINFYRKTKIEFRKSLQPFFEKIYFSSKLNSQCFSLIGPESTSYKCDFSKERPDFPSIGIIINGYIYFIPSDLLFRETKQGDRSEFLIKITNGESKIVLGSDFLDYFDIAFNNGNSTINMYNKNYTVKLNVELSDGWNDGGRSINITPGSLCLLSVFGIVATIVIWFFGCFCFGKKDDIDLDDTLLSAKE